MFEFMNQGPNWIFALTTLCVAANAITALTPTKADDKIVGGILKCLNVISLNVGKNRNLDEEKK